MASFFIMTMTFGSNYCFGVFFKPLIQEFGWPRGVISGAYSLMTFISGFLGILAGKLSDRGGPRVVAVFIGLFLGAGFLLLSRISTIWHFYIIHALVLAPGIGSCWTGLLPPIARWFIAKRGIMTGIVVSGIGFGVLAVPPLAEWIISIYEWRKAYSIMGIFILLLIVTLAQFLKRDPYQMGLLPFGMHVSHEKEDEAEKGFSIKEAVRTGPFMLLCLLYFSYGYCLHTFMVHTVPYAIDYGISSSGAAGILMMIGGASIVNRLVIAGVSDRIGVKQSLTMVLFILLISQFFIHIAGNVWIFYLFGFFFGTAYGGAISLMALVTAEFFGLKALGVILGAVTFSYTIGGSLGPMVSGYLFDLVNSYKLAFGIATGLAVLSFITSVILKPHGK